MLESSTIRTKILGVSLFKSFDQFVEQWKKGDDAVDSCHTSFISNQVTHAKRRKPIVHFDKVPLNLSIFSFMKRFLSKELRSHVLMFRNRAQSIEEGWLLSMLSLKRPLDTSADIYSYFSSKIASCSEVYQCPSLKLPHTHVYSLRIIIHWLKACCKGFLSGIRLAIYFSIRSYSRGLYNCGDGFCLNVVVPKPSQSRLEVFGYWVEFINANVVRK